MSVCPFVVPLGVLSFLKKCPGGLLWVFWKWSLLYFKVCTCSVMLLSNPKKSVLSSSFTFSSLMLPWNYSSYFFQWRKGLLFVDAHKKSPVFLWPQCKVLYNRQLSCCVRLKVVECVIVMINEKSPALTSTSGHVRTSLLNAFWKKLLKWKKKKRETTDLKSWQSFFV